MLVTVASVAMAASEPSSSTPDSFHLSPGVTTLANSHKLHLPLELSASLPLALDLLWFLDLFYFLFLEKISSLLYLVFLKRK